MKSTLVTVGCSITKDNYQKTWANFLLESIDYELLNIGACGASISFLSKRSILELSNHDPNQTVVVVMLPSSNRVDLYMDQNHPLLLNQEKFL